MEPVIEVHCVLLNRSPWQLWWLRFIRLDYRKSEIASTPFFHLKWVKISIFCSGKRLHLEIQLKFIQNSRLLNCLDLTFLLSSHIKLQNFKKLRLYQILSALR